LTKSHKRAKFVFRFLTKKQKMEEKKVSKNYYLALQARVTSFEQKIRLIQKMAREDSFLGVDTSLEIQEEKILQRALKKAKADLRSAKVVAGPKDNGLVQIGSTVTVRINGAAHSFRLEGIACFPGVVNVEAPLGKKLLGKAKGTVINIQKNNYEILEVAVKDF
jgi:hypothetical protein